jgi:hypothetical protein
MDDEQITRLAVSTQPERYSDTSAGWAPRLRLTAHPSAAGNAAWAVRNSRVGAGFNPLALRMVLTEAERLTADGEPLWDVLEAFAELLNHP